MPPHLGSPFNVLSRTGPFPALLFATLAVTGCSTEPARTDLSLSPAYRHALATTADSGDAQWWRQFGDDNLTRLVERTAAANRDIGIALARARQARAGQSASEARLYPGLELTASRSDSRSGLPAAVKQTMPDTRATRAGIEVGWEIDLFGGAHAAASAARHDAAAASYGVAGAQLLAVSEVARQYFVWQGARQRLAILEALLQTRRDTERLVRSRRREGLASDLEVEQAAGESQDLAASLPPLRTLMDVSEHRIAVLSGGDASQPVAELQSASAYAWSVPGSALTGQPIDLLRRRPDVLAAEQGLAAESARLAEARANLFPTLFLGAVFGRQDLTLNNSLDLAAARYSNVALAFALPIFTAGRIQAGIDAQSGREREALLAYEKAILSAVEDVENSLVALAGERQRVEALSRTLASRRRAVAHATSLYREGQADLLQLLDVQRGQLATELALAESQAQRAVDYVQLYKALGGGAEPTNSGEKP